MTTNPFCQCGYRESAHMGANKGCPLADGFKNVLGQTVYKHAMNPGVTFVRSEGFTATARELSAK